MNPSLLDRTNHQETVPCNSKVDLAIEDVEVLITEACRYTKQLNLTDE